ncbi:MAG: tRNA (adenosine(37)-N6)-threonylcarbamoyltransferase complex transferase subunit TsaD [Melioribacteraceae bacterium]|nr:tRNA (adenosine(37)-N6)-threonylcarbamoyltransferase complex transferase subunit TsaD [Melioribacteraceae bacterium]
MNVLGIETSCDETSVAVISNGQLKVNLISSQDFHIKFGGVVPELSSRAHLQTVTPLMKEALHQAMLELKEIEVIAATAGPGLIGALLVGLTFAKGLCYSLDKTFIPVNHIEGHIFSGFLMEDKPQYPYLCLVVSGGHSLLLIVEDDLRIKKLGGTIDDAAGEAFDKAAKMMGLGYPGGPNIQMYAEKGNPDAIKFPIAQLKNKYDYSFSGLKTALLRFIQKEYEGKVPESDLPDLAASFQKTISDTLTTNVIKALNEYKVKSISVVGGVAANRYIQNAFHEIAESRNLKLVIPDQQYCGDNAAMIAYRGMLLHLNKKKYNLGFNAFPSISEGMFSDG